MSITKKELFKIGDQTVAEYILSNGTISVGILNFGGRIRSFSVKGQNAVLGYKNAEDYVNDEYFLGATIGRVCGRIENAKFSIGKKEYFLDKNDGENCLHGGKYGFYRKIFKAKVEDDALSLELLSRSECGFPGEIKFRVRFSLNANALKIEYFACASEDTPVNFTNHTYFDLGDIKETQIFIDADKITPVNENLIPKGYLSVENTPFDFKKFKKIGEGINSDDILLNFCGGYDVNYVLNGTGFRKVASAISEKFILNVYTDRPAMQFYTGNFLPDLPEKGLKKCGAFCFETQSFSNAVNDDNYPSIILRCGEDFYSTTVYEINVKG